MNDVRHAELEAWVQSLPGSEAVRSLIRGLAGKRVMIVTHEDPDGITSGLLLMRGLTRLGAHVEVALPPEFQLWPDIWERIRPRQTVDALFILDKGTFPDYDAFTADGMVVAVIDHHFNPTVPRKCLFVNPNLTGYTPCSNSLLVYSLLQGLTPLEPADDLLNIIGLTGDWAINYATGPVSADKKLLYGYMNNLPAILNPLFEPITERPTWFEVQQRERTVTLNRIAELVHAVGGGAFQYYYHDRHPALADLDHAQFMFDQLASYCREKPDLPSLHSLDSFINEMPDCGRLRMIWEFFLADWDETMHRLDASFPLVTVHATKIFLFIGEKVKLMPMIGSVKLYELKQGAKADNALLVMVSALEGGGVHVSVRGTAFRFNSGTMCRKLSERLRTKFGALPRYTGGGGHPVAAEMVSKSPQIDLMNVLHEIMGVLNDARQHSLAE